MNIKLLASNPFGTVDEPPGVSHFGGGSLIGIGWFVSMIIKSLITIAGIYAVLQIVLAGFAFISAGGDPKQIAMAWSKIWQAILGLLVAAGSLVIAAVVGQLIFGDANAILDIRIYTP